ncbi:hypothetical protein HDU98_007377 [Podochytrium sp. JEL0797]|nr:hypothetical protein HDU98_007377 [Podochytrium sp. JEL0797]
MTENLTKSETVVLGEERKPTPDLFAPFTPVEGAAELSQQLKEAEDKKLARRFTPTVTILATEGKAATVGNLCPLLQYRSQYRT